MSGQATWNGETRGNRFAFEPGLSRYPWPWPLSMEFVSYRLPRAV